ncbi:helix-turn-helix domain-containing protein [Magnetospirillum fulvum]|uniref:Helix-turn-helix domain-containing protein n=1 Tax=Magnetospirillum fulvum TaxID=1082 RepID=A0A1H6INW8_MAGFU|nr:helix-turn-helix transcriptional regulator [Magnetospirillum fulvum]SEH49684.1 Helix-turn-helix domain-containing protein [Magnetospirillum fulvum]
MTNSDTVTIPRAEYEAMQTRIEDLDDILAGHAARTGVTLPHDFAMRIINGDHPVRVWREYRALSAVALAEAAKVSKAYLSEIETGKKPGSVEAYKSLAAALAVPVDALLG